MFASWIELCICEIIVYFDTIELDELVLSYNVFMINLAEEAKDFYTKEELISTKMQCFGKYI